MLWLDSVHKVSGHANFVPTLHPAPGSTGAIIRVIYWMCVWQLYFPSAQKHFEQPKGMYNLNVSLLKSKTKNQAKQTKTKNHHQAKTKTLRQKICQKVKRKVGMKGSGSQSVSLRDSGEYLDFVNQNNECTKNPPKGPDRPEADTWLLPTSCSSSFLC